MMQVKLRMPQPSRKGRDVVYQAVIKHLPQDQKRLFYIEPYGGTGEVLLNKAPSSEEAFNDLDPDKVLLYRSIRDRTADLLKALEKPPPQAEPPEGLDRVVWLLRDLRPRAGWVRHLNRLAERLGNVYVFNRTAMEVLKAFDDEDVVAFVDPPPMPQTRNVEKTSPLMATAEEHLELAEVLRAFRGKVILSAETCPVYNRLFKSWSNYKNTQECLWTNW
jgi:DNA adenine methylase